MKKKNIVIVAGFQGINEKMDITTLGRGGSDTTAVAIAVALKSKKCYIFSDVDGVYTADPNIIADAQKIEEITYDEMKEISTQGAKVLHNRSIEIAEKFKIPVIAQSTFNNNIGTSISDKIEENTLKSIIKKDVSKISIIGNGITRNLDFVNEIINEIKNNNLEIIELLVSEYKISIIFKDIINDDIVKKFHSHII